MKTFFNILFALTLSVSFGYSQNVGINTSGAVPNGSSMLDIVSTDKGLLIPRVDIVDLSTPLPVTVTPETSLLVYNTNTTSELGYYFWDGAKWVKLLDANNAAWHKVTTTKAPTLITDSIFTNGTVGIGTELTTSPFQVVGLEPYTNNADAIANGLLPGAFYRTALGIVMVVYTP